MGTKTTKLAKKQRWISFRHPTTQELTWGIVEEDIELARKSFSDGFFVVSNAITPEQCKIRFGAIEERAETSTGRQAWIPYLDSYVLLSNDAYTQHVYRKMLDLHNIELCLPKDGRLHVGHQFAVKVNDGHANYIVTHIGGGKCRIEWRGWDYRRYTDAEFGWGGEFDVTKIEEMVRPEEEDRTKSWKDNAAAIFQSLSQFVFPLENHTFQKIGEPKVIKMKTRHFAFYQANVGMLYQAMNWVMADLGYAVLSTEEKQLAWEIIVGNANRRFGIVLERWMEDEVSKVSIQVISPKIPPITKPRTPKPNIPRLECWQDAAKMILESVRVDVLFRHLQSPHSLMGSVLEAKWEFDQATVYLDANESETQRVIEEAMEKIEHEKDGFSYQSKGATLQVTVYSEDQKFSLAIEWREQSHDIVRLIISSRTATSLDLKEPVKKKKWMEYARMMLKSLFTKFRCVDSITLTPIEGEKINSGTGRVEAFYYEAPDTIHEVLMEIIDDVDYEVHRQIEFPKNPSHFFLGPKSGMSPILEVFVKGLRGMETAITHVIIKPDPHQSKSKSEPPGWKLDARKILTMFQEKFPSVDYHTMNRFDDLLEFHEDVDGIFALFYTEAHVAYDAIWPAIGNLNGMSPKSSLRPATQRLAQQEGALPRGYVDLVTHGCCLHIMFQKLTNVDNEDQAPSYPVTKIRVSSKELE